MTEGETQAVDPDDPGRADTEPAKGKVGRAPLLWGALVVAGLALLALGLTAKHFDPARLHLYGQSSRLNDQAGYITTARILADTGELRSGLLMPAFVHNPASRVYMPGHYAALALSYKLFGYSVFTSLLPSLLAFVLSAVGVFLIGARRYGLFVGVAASLCVILFPPNLLFAFTAMAEGTFQAAGVLAFCAFTFLGPRARVFAAPLLVALPFLFRETGALWLLPMALVLLQETRSGRWRRTSLLALATVAVVLGAQRWQLATGKESPPLTWLTGSGFNYGDSQAADDPEARIILSEFPGLVSANVRRNVDNLRTKVLEEPGSFEGSSVLVLAALLSACLLIGIFRARRDVLPLAAAGLGIATWCLAFGLYDVAGLKLLRTSLFFAPLCLVALVGAIGSGLRLEQRRPQRVFAVLLGMTALSWAAWTVPVCREAGAEMVAGDQDADQRREMLERANHDDDTLLVAPWLLGLEYAVQHYPVRYSFPAENPASLRALEEVAPIGTLIVHRNKSEDLSRAAILDMGFEEIAQLKGAKGAAVFQVYRRPR